MQKNKSLVNGIVLGGYKTISVSLAVPESTTRHIKREIKWYDRVKPFGNRENQSN